MPRVKMKLTAKERKQGVDLRNFTVVPIKDASMRRRMGGAAMLVKKDPPKRVKNTFAPKSEKPKKKPEIEATLLVCCNDIEAVEDEIEEWDNSASLDVVKTFTSKKLAEAKKSADASASGSNVDFVVYEVREIYRAKRGF